MSDRQARWLLIAVLLAQFILLTAQAPDADSERSRLESIVLRAVAPLAHLSKASVDGLGAIGSRFRARRTLLSENEKLRSQLEELRRERFRFLALESDLERLAEAVGYSRAAVEPEAVADIVYMHTGSWSQGLVAYLGEYDAVANQSVVSTEGLVGRVVSVAGPYARVQLVTDGAASVGAMIERTRRQGILRGLGRETLALDFVPLQEDVRTGDLVITAGIDGVYPRGIPIGTVVSVKPGSELFHDIEVRTSVDFGQLDQVYLVPRLEIPDDASQEGSVAGR